MMFVSSSSSSVCPGAHPLSTSFPAFFSVKINVSGITSAQASRGHHYGIKSSNAVEHHGASTNEMELETGKNHGTSSITCEMFMEIDIN